jgi:two-component system response regulator AtoC
MGKPARRLAPGALDALMAYLFPGNIRELENILERAMIACEDETIVAADLDLGRARPRQEQEEAGSRAAPPGTPSEPSHSSSMGEIERQAITRALAKWNGNRTKAARELGISRRTIINKIKRYGLE